LIHRVDLKLSSSAWKKEETVEEQFKPKTEVVNDFVKSGSAKSSVEDMVFDFDEAEDVGQKKEIFSIYGQKNDGKTTISYGVPNVGDKVLVFSFDKKSVRPKDAPYIKDGNLEIKVIDAIRYVDQSNEQKYLDSSVITHKFVLSILEQSTERFAPDWVMFDGTERMAGIMEIVMRAKNNLKPYQGIANRSLWRERKQYLDDIHKKATEIAKKGVIYTMYSQKDEIIDEGAVTKKVDIPKWIGSIMEETDVVIHAEVKSENGGRKFYAHVEGSKIPEKYPDGVYDVTGKRVRDVIEREVANTY
jgi:hypothetical protein